MLASENQSSVPEVTRVAPNKRANEGALRRWAPRRGHSLAGMGVVLTGALGVVLWHHGPQPTKGARAANSGPALPLAHTAKADDARQALPKASLVPTIKAADEPSATQPVGTPAAVTTPLNPPETPADPSVGSSAQTHEPPTPPMPAAALPLAEETFTPESRPLPEGGSAGVAAASPVLETTAVQAPGDDEDKTDDDGPSPSTNNHAKTSARARSHHHAHLTPTPAPNFFQRMFGLKPKPKAN